MSTEEVVLHTGILESVSQCDALVALNIYNVPTVKYQIVDRVNQTILEWNEISGKDPCLVTLHHGIDDWVPRCDTETTELNHGL